MWQWLRTRIASHPPTAQPVRTALEVALFVQQESATTYHELVDQRLPIIKALLEYHADPNINHRDASDTTSPVSMLFYAVDIKHERLTKLLLQHGASPDVADSRDEFTPLMRAAFYPDTLLLKQLLAQGANVNAQQKYGRTALMIACDAGNANTALLLLAHHAEINHRSRFGQTALTAAQNHQNKLLIHFLLQAGAKP